LDSIGKQRPGIAVLSDWGYRPIMAAMRGITIKLSEATLRRLRREADATGRSVADLVRERLDSAAFQASDSVHARTSDLAGSLAGSRKAATNQRRRFRKS
jgi:hypothetical protein